VGAKFHAKSALNTDYGLVFFLVPEYGINDARLLTEFTPDAFGFDKRDAAFFIGDQRMSGTNFSTGRLKACAANDNGKIAFNSARGFNPDTGIGQTGVAVTARTGKHTALATHTAFVVFDR
jgi:hypothetical protein